MLELEAEGYEEGEHTLKNALLSSSRQKSVVSETVAGILDSIWTGQGLAFILPVSTFFPGEPTMFGPGAYVPDPTEGLVDVQDLPAPQQGFYSRNHQQTPCARCGHLASRHKSDQRTLHDLGDLCTGRPVDLLVTYSSHYCSDCRKHFNIDLTDLAPPGSHYTHRVIDLAVRVVVEESLPSRPASWHLWRDHRVFVPFATIQNWVEAGGKKGARSHGRRLSGLGA